VEDLSVQRGIMGFDRASEVYAARRFPWRPLRFSVDLPGVVEAVGNRDEIEAALPRVREVLAPGLINLAEVDLYAPGLIVLPFTEEPSRDVL
jgi:PII-like signaling protein